MVFVITRVSKNYVYFEWQDTTFRKKMKEHGFEVGDKIYLTHFDI